MGYIVIGGDIVPTASNRELFSEKGGMKKLVKNGLLELIYDADERIFNLETPITDNAAPLEKEGPCFYTPSACVQGICELRPTLLTLANNHILDQGCDGLRETMHMLKDKNIQYTGVGENIEDAKKTAMIDMDGKKIAVLGCVETEYSVAGKNYAGAYGFDPLETPDWIRETKQSCDYLIVLYHGGKEYYRYPSPELQKRCRKIVDCGADLVICQHSHCIGCFEKHGNGEILYGQGNFILDSYSKVNAEFYKTSILVKIEIDDGLTVSYIPITKDGNGVKLAEKGVASVINREFLERSEKIKDADFVERNYIEYADMHGARYICRLSRLGFLVSAVDNRFFGGRLLRGKSKCLLGHHQRLTIENCLQCETHNELIRAYLKNR